MRWRLFLSVVITLGLAACNDPLPVAIIGAGGPAFDPITFWTGHVRSWGVLENRGGGPTDVVRTDCLGTVDGTNGLHMIQTITMGDGVAENRDWHMRRLTPGRFEATANDMVGTAMGDASGRAFHWSWVLATRPGASWRDVTMDQWMYLQDDGSLLVRTTIRKLGAILVEVTERFERVG